MALCLNVVTALAQDLDSIYYRNQRMKYVEEWEKKYDSKLLFIYDEKEVPLETYLELPQTSIARTIVVSPENGNGKNPMFCIFSTAPEIVGETKNPYDKDCEIFYISGGIPPQFKYGNEELAHYILEHRKIPAHLYDININGIVYVYCYFDEEGHLWKSDLEKIEIKGPLHAEILFSANVTGEKSAIFRDTEVFSKEYSERLDQMAKEALRLVNEMPDFEPGRCFFKPAKYRIVLQIPFMDNPNFLEYYGGIKRNVELN